MRRHRLGVICLGAAIVLQSTVATMAFAATGSGGGEVAATAPAPAQPAGPPPSVDVLEAQMLSTINAERAAAGVGAVQSVGWAHSVAEQHSQDMAAKQSIWHNISGFIDQGRAAMGAVYLGENVAMDSTLAADDALLYSDLPHRNVTLDARFNSVGVGVALDSKNWVYVTEDFAQIPGGAAPAAPRAVAQAAPVTIARPVAPKAPVVAAMAKPQVMAPAPAALPAAVVTTAPLPAPAKAAVPRPAALAAAAVPVAHTSKLTGGLLALLGMAILSVSAWYAKRLLGPPTPPIAVSRPAWSHPGPSCSLASSASRRPAWQKAS